MSQDVRVLLKLAATLVLGAGAFVLILIAIGAGECDRGDCSWYVEIFDGREAMIGLGACIFVAGCVIWSVDLILRRAFQHRPRR